MAAITDSADKSSVANQNPNKQAKKTIAASAIPSRNTLLALEDKGTLQCVQADKVPGSETQFFSLQ